jgi:UDP-2,3-diacylglucosamine pyrophosphatase LpxH
LRAHFDRLILNGDTIDSLDFRRFRARDWRIVELLQDIARRRELVLVRGNHDGHFGPDGGCGARAVLGDLLGTPMIEECEVETDAGRLLVLHGDQFDQTLNLTWLGDVADWGYRKIQGLSKPTARWLKGRVKHLGGVVASVSRGATRRAMQRGCIGVVTGHTHYPDDARLNGVRYLNSGSWVDWPCSAIVIENGQARLRHWETELFTMRHVALAMN